MDNMNVTTKCMTLSPGELAKLGVELDSLAPTANAHPKNDNVAHAIETPATTSQDQKTYGIYSKDESCILLDNNVSTPTKILEPEKLFYKESEENMKKSFKNNNTKRNSKIRILSNIKVQITKNELRSLLDKKKVDCTTCPTVIKNSTKNCTFDPQCNSANLKIKDATDEINNSALNVEGNDKFEKQKPQKAGENHSSNQLNSTKILEAEALVLKDLNKNSACTAQSGSAKSTIGIKKTSNNCNGKFEPQEKHNTAEEYSSIRSNLNKILETGKLVYEQQCTAKVNKASLKKNYQNKCLDIFEKDDNDISFAGYSESDMEADIKMFDEFLDETCEIDKENFDNTSTIPRKIHASTISDLEEPEGNGVPSIIDEEENLEISDGFPEKNPDVKSMSYSRKPERIDVPSIINVEESMEIFDAFPVKNSNIDLELFDEFLGETSEINKEEDNMDISNDTSDRLQKTHASTISDLREPTKINDPSIINVENMKIYNALPQKNPDVKLISGSKKPERIDVPSIINVEENMEIFNAFPMKNSDIDLELFDEFQGEISEINKEEDNLDISNDTSDTPQKTHASTISDLRHPEKIDVPSIINVRESLEISDGFPEKNPVVKIISDSRKPERMDVPSIINVEENMEIFDAFPVKSSDIDLELFDEFLGETSDINKEEDNIDISNDTYGRPQKTRASTSSDFKEPEKIDVPSIMNVEENMEIFDTFPVKNSDIDLELFDEFLGETSGINKEEDNMDISNDTSGRPQKTHASTISDLREPEKIDDPSIINVEEKRDISDRFSEKSDSRKPERIDVPSIINVEQNMEIFDAFPVENSDIDLKLFDEFLGETSEIKMEEDIDIFENTSGRPRKTHISTISDLEDPEKIEAPSVINVEENMEMLDTFAVKHSNANSELFDEFPPETNTESNTSHDIFDEENSNIYCKKLIADFQEKLENLVTKNCEGLPERAEENNINHNINDCSQNEQDPLSKYNFQFETNNGHFFKPKFNESEFEKEENSSKSSDIHDIAQILGGKVDYNILETLLNINIEIIEEDPNIDEYLDDTLENDESNKVVKSKFSESSLEKEEDLSKMSDINNVEQLSDERVEINMIDEFLDKNSKVIEEDLNIFDEYVDINPNDNIDETVENEESNKVDIDYKESKEPTTVNIYPDTCLVEETPIPIINSSKLKYWNLKRSIAKLAKVKIKTSEPFKRERKKSKNNPILELPKLKIKEKLPGRFKLNGAKQKKANSLNKSDGRKRQIDYIISSDSDSDVPLSKLLKNSGGKTETYRKSKKTNVTIDSNSMKEPDSSINQSISEAPKRKRGRPKKSVVPVVVTQHLIEIPEKIDISNSKRQMQKEKIKQVEMERESNSLIMNNSSNDENDDIPIKVLTQTSLNDFITNTDSQKKLVSDKMAIQKRKPGRPKLNGTKQDNSNGRKRQINKHIASSDSDSDIPLSKILKNSDGKIETCSTSEKTNITIDSNSIKQPDSLVNESVSDAPKKKRGRPKKSDVPVVVPVESKEEIIFTKSKKGRQRKEIDYSLLEDCEPKSTNSSPTVTKPSKKVSKYKYSGNTTLALKQIFSSFEGKNADDVSIDESNSRKRGRRVIKDDFSDEEGTVTCAVCSETVTNQDWADHKRKVHYNLAWKKGETAINVSDNSAIMNVYEQLRKEQGFLKCKKCKKKCAKSKEFMLHLEKCNEIVKANGMVICAVCKKELSKNEWTYHKYKEHNNLAWREGDQELNLNDQDIVMRILTQLYKSKKPLHCEKCKVQKKSVVGYLSHKTVCQKSQEEMESVKVACKLCGQKVLPVSMDYHLKAHNKPEWPKQISASDYFSVDVGTGGKRKAATRALNVIQSIKGVNSSKYYTEQCDFEESWVLKRLRKKYTDIDQVFCIFNNNNCEFKSDSLENLIHHLNSCENKPEQYFVCKLCLVWTRDEVEIENHVKIDHNKVNVDNDGEFNDVGVEEENESDVDKFEDELLKEQHKLRQNRKQLLTGTSLVHKVKPIFLVYPMREQKSLFYPQAYPWMMNFCEKRYSNCYLFESFRSKEPHRVLDCDILDEYLPKLLESCDISVKELNVNDKLGDLEFRKLGLFEVSKSYKGESTIYCGGPIACLAWLPTPFQAEIYDQILAVSVINHPEKEYAVGETYSEPSVIQFWNCGQVHWQKDDDFNPYLLFGLALSTGPIWHMEWCPSGCLDLANNDKLTCRLGLLAVATSDSYAYIYSIDNIKEENDKGLIYKCEPSVKLQLENVKTSTNYYATKISWTKAKDHRYIAVGYSSGIVAIFDLLSSSTLWQKENQEGTRIILPYLTFQAHVSCVTSLSLCHYGEGNRWCFTTGLDKVTTFWDLSNMTKQMTNKKYGVSDGQFLTQWPVALCAEDETTFNDTVSAHSFIRPIREVLSSDFCCFTNSPSGIKSVSFSDWLNLILHGSNAGEVMGQFSHRMFFNIDKKQFKSNYVKCIFSIAKLISKNNDTKPPLCSTFEEAREHYGIVFTDYNSDKLSNIPNTRTNNLTKVSLEKLNIHNYPLQAVTKVAANPNPQACTYWASGYQAGFIRIRHIEVLKKSFNPTIFVNYDFSKTI